MDGVQIPGRLKKFPLYRGRFPIPYTTLIGPDGQPDFKVIDQQKRTEALNKFLCHLCGERLLIPFCLIGGPLAIVNRAFNDGPMHAECALYACKVCPYLARTDHGHSSADPKHKGTVRIKTDEYVVPGRPDRMALAYCRSYRVDSFGVVWAGEFDSVDWSQMPERVEG
jgi:hypothetical protein